MKEKIKWPKISDTKEWTSLDEELNKVLKVVQVGTAERKVESMTAVVYNSAKECFGMVPREETKDKPEKQPSRKETMIEKLSAEIKILNKQYKKGQQWGKKKESNKLQEHSL